MVDAVSGKVLLLLKRPRPPPCSATDVCWSIANEWLLVGYSTGEAALYVVQTGALLRYIKVSEKFSQFLLFFHF
jgi:hypothetical protein